MRKAGTALLPPHERPRGKEGCGSGRGRQAGRRTQGSFSVSPPPLTFTATPLPEATPTLDDGSVRLTQGLPMLLAAGAAQEGAWARTRAPCTVVVVAASANSQQQSTGTPVGEGADGQATGKEWSGQADNSAFRLKALVVRRERGRRARRARFRRQHGLPTHVHACTHAPWPLRLEPSLPLSALTVAPGTPSDGHPVPIPRY